MKDFISIKYLSALLGAAVLAALEASHGSQLWIFAVACLTLIPLAGIIGQSTEMIAERTGPKIGGALNATLGNAAELIITLVALQKGYLELVKASIIGSAIGNLLLVTGLAMMAGGMRYGAQKFDKQTAEHNSTMLFSVVMLFSIPTVFVHTTQGVPSETVNEMSLGLAAGMFIVYALGMYFSFTAPKGDTALTRPSAEHGHEVWSIKKSAAVLAVSTVTVVFTSEVLVGSLEHVLKTVPGISELFLGLIIVPVVGNTAEHIVAVQVSHKNNNMTLAMEITAGSSIQLLLFVAPVLVFASLIFGHRLDLAFNLFEWAALIGSCVIVSRVAGDGESNYFEGGILVIMYIMVAWACFELPALAG